MKFLYPLIASFALFSATNILANTCPSGTICQQPCANKPCELEVVLPSCCYQSKTTQKIDIVKAVKDGYRTLDCSKQIVSNK